jgi:hypothetical protein
MAAVDPDDDSIDRWVVYRYAFDPDRRERRHRVVASFDNEAEFLELIARLGHEVRTSAAEGRIHPREHVSGQHLAAGYRSAQQARRLEREIWLRRARRDQRT